MKCFAKYQIHSAAACALLLTTAVVAYGAKPLPPPPPPPAATYGVEFLWTGDVTAMNQAGDMIGTANGEPCLYIADLNEVVNPNMFLSADDAERWLIDGIGSGINNVDGFTCLATYLSDDGEYIQNRRYPCRMNWFRETFTGTIEPYITSTPPGFGDSPGIQSRGLMDDGTVCGWLRSGDRAYSFVVSPENELSYPWGGPLDSPAWDSYAEGMNDSGQIVGRIFLASGIVSYRYTPATDTFVSLEGQVKSINNHGDTAGVRNVTITTTKPNRTTTVTRTYRYTDDGNRYSDDDASGIKVFDQDYYPDGINDAGDIVADDAGGGPLEAFVYLETKKKWVDLTAAGVVQGSSAAAVAEWYRLSNPDGSYARRYMTGINNAGCIGGTIDDGAVGRVFVLRPTSP